jgi:DnaJ-class molecular chaperone
MNSLNVQLLGIHFGLVPPVALEELKSIYRKRCKALHPDQNPAKDAHIAFIEMKKAYDVLIEDSDLFLDRDKIAEKTEDGVLFSVLGLGLRDPTKNGCTCEYCDGLGRKQEDSGFEFCDACGGNGWGYSFTCPDCGGTGEFFQPNAKRKVVCRRCEGSGSISFERLHLCIVCHGRRVKSRRKIWKVCYKCEGTGEIEIFNPVLPKNLLFGGVVSR